MSKDISVPSEFIATIPIKNEHGRVVGEKQFVVYAGLLALAHDLGVERIDTEIVQMPERSNNTTAVVRAVVHGKRGVFSGIGDANPTSVNRKVVRHLLRVAETRAKARALRDYCNVGLVALEELGDDELTAADRRAAGARPALEHAPSGKYLQAAKSVTNAQRRALWRRTLALGYDREQALAFLSERLGGNPRAATREQVSRLLSELAAEPPRASSAVSATMHHERAPPARGDGAAERSSGSYPRHQSRIPAEDKQEP